MQNKLKPSLSLRNFCRCTKDFWLDLTFFLDKSKHNKSNKIGFTIFGVMFLFLCVLHVSACIKNLKKRKPGYNRTKSELSLSSRGFFRRFARHITIHKDYTELGGGFATFTFFFL